MNNSFVILWLSCDILLLINHAHNAQLPEAFQLHLIFFISQTNKRFLLCTFLVSRVQSIILLLPTEACHLCESIKLPSFHLARTFFLSTIYSICWKLLGCINILMTRVTLVDLQVAWLLAKWIKSSLKALCTLSEACVFACKITKQMIERIKLLIISGRIITRKLWIPIGIQ